MHAATDIANYLLWKGAKRDENDISHLKLQKLLYYVQGFCLAALDSPAFSDEVLAWEHGPVVRSVYDQFRSNRNEPIPAPTDFDPMTISTDVREVADEVFEAYGQFSAWRLREMTHEEAPWEDTPRDGVISRDLLKSFFKTRLRDE